MGQFMSATQANRKLQAGNNRVTLSMTDLTSVFQVQQSDGAGSWIATSIGGSLLQLNSSDTVISFYAPFESRLLRVSGTAAVNIYG